MRIWTFDTTLRDGTQGEAVSFSVEDKVLIAQKLDDLGIDYIEGGWPGFGISGFTTFGLADNYMPYFRSDPQFQWVGNGNWTRGKHNIRFGAELSWQRLNHSQPEFYGGSWGASGGFGFGGGPTTLKEMVSENHDYRGEW